MNKAAHAFWAFSNWYGAALGRAWLAPVHHLFLNLSLHGLGYDNSRHTGEEWFIAHILAKSDVQVCIDIGANVGAYSAMLARHLPAASIYAVEPSSSSFKELEKCAAENAGKIIAINAAVSDTNGTATLYSRAELSEKASLVLSPGESSARIEEEVKLMTLDSLVGGIPLPRIDFIKIDTEGHEREVFLGLQETLRTKRPQFIQFEFNHVHLYRGTTLYSLSQMLDGYELYRLLPRGWTKIDPTKHANNAFMFCNIVAKRVS